MLRHHQSSLPIKVLLVFSGSIFLWLIIDLIALKTVWKWTEINFDYFLYLMQYVIFLFSLRSAFTEEQKSQAWLKRALAALLILIGFMILVLPIMLILHTSIGGQL
ncbi:hypothetical protein [Acinetobacter sp. ANC 4862]|uniref:hypothetical protein n=2 Tax=Acinetobacter Taxon 24D TaxID=2839057 RepID=UPI00103D970F|nr:hypothetical protein [Acinetobacter sp. ANC 4862]TCH65652.1 hypothetical protein E0409_00160 [Acinetobacter sp. ANC 4862]